VADFAISQVRVYRLPLFKNCLVLIFLFVLSLKKFKKKFSNAQYNEQNVYHTHLRIVQWLSKLEAQVSDFNSLCRS